MTFRLLTAIVLATLLALVQTLVSLGGAGGMVDSVARPSDSHARAVAFAQDDEDSDNDNEDEDDEDSDNEDEDDADDGEDNDNDTEEDADDGEDNDNDNDADDDLDEGLEEDVGEELDEDLDGDLNTPAPVVPASMMAPPAGDPALPTTPATGTSTGGDVAVALGGERVVVTMFPWMPSGVTVTVRRAEPGTVAAAPGAQAGDLLFTIEARDATGASLTALPAEVNLSVRYNDQDVAALSEQRLTLARLNPADNQWKAAPKLVREPASNYVAASITELGTYVVYAP